MRKEEIRSVMVHRRDAMQKEEASMLSSKICAKIIGLEVVGKCRSVGIYLPFRNEVAVDSVFDTLSYSGKRIYAPFISDGKMAFAKLESLTDTTKGAYGITEPVAREDETDLIDVLIVPGLAFDRIGNRIGWGHGYYDSVLRDMSAIKIGAAYGFQLMRNRIDTDAHDARMDMVVTEDEVVECGGD